MLHKIIGFCRFSPCLDSPLRAAVISVAAGFATLWWVEVTCGASAAGAYRMLAPACMPG
jgi:hypothetical protein